MQIYLIKQFSKYSNKSIKGISTSFSYKKFGINRLCHNIKCFSSNSFNFNKQSSIDNIMEESREDNSYRSSSYQSSGQRNKRNRISFVRDGMILSFYLRQVILLFNFKGSTLG